MANTEFLGTASFGPHRDIRGIVTRAVSTARAAGRDYLAQSRAAAAAVVAVRPDLSPLEALDTVNRLRDFGDA